jgi:DNA-binding transcriptional MocR family regulator
VACARALNNSAIRHPRQHAQHLAQEHQFVLVENDIYADMDASSRPSLASLSQLRQVAYVGSFLQDPSCRAWPRQKESCSAPGSASWSAPRPTGWLRFNVAFSEDERIWRFLARSIDERKGD